MQNELIETCGEIVLKKVVQNVNCARYFSVMADETADASKKEQFSLCVRYVHCEEGQPENISVREDFLGFQEVTDMM